MRRFFCKIKIHFWFAVCWLVNAQVSTYNAYYQTNYQPYYQRKHLKKLFPNFLFFNFEFLIEIKPKDTVIMEIVAAQMSTASLVWSAVTTIVHVLKTFNSRLT